MATLDAARPRFDAEAPTAPIAGVEALSRKAYYGGAANAAMNASSSSSTPGGSSPGSHRGLAEAVERLERVLVAFQQQQGASSSTSRSMLLCCCCCSVSFSSLPPTHRQAHRGLARGRRAVPGGGHRHGRGRGRGRVEESGREEGEKVVVFIFVFVFVFAAVVVFQTSSSPSPEPCSGRSHPSPGRRPGPQADPGRRPRLHHGLGLGRGRRPGPQGPAGGRGRRGLEPDAGRARRLVFEVQPVRRRAVPHVPGRGPGRPPGAYERGQGARGVAGVLERALV